MIDFLTKPTLSQNVEYGFEEDIHYLYHQSENKVLLLENAVAYKIIKHCNGGNKIEDIVLLIANEFSHTNRLIIESDLIEMLLFLEKENFIVFKE